MLNLHISGGVNLTVIPNTKFKRNRLSVSFIIPNSRDKATMYAMLPGLLERAYTDYPDLRLFSRKLAKMYDARVGVTGNVLGRNRIIKFSIQGIKNEYCPGGEDLLSEMCDVLLGMIFRPCVENESFNPRWVDIEKTKLKEDILTEINDKRSYCVKNARRKFFGDRPEGVERLGYYDEIDGITPHQLYICYMEMLRKARVEINITANDADETVEKFRIAFESERQGWIKPYGRSALPGFYIPDKYTETVDAVQSKLCLVFTTCRPLDGIERYRMMVATALFGGTANSRLFKNVREKMSLCYYCSASYNNMTGSMTVDSGVEHNNIDVTLKAILDELEDLIYGEITDSEISETKLALKNRLYSTYDVIQGLENWYLNEKFMESNRTPEEAAANIDKVTARHIKDVLYLLSLNVIYILTK